MAQAVDALTPSPVVRKAPVAKGSATAGADTGADAPSIVAPPATGADAGATAPAVDAIVSAILAGAYDIKSMLAIRCALDKARSAAGSAAGAANGAEMAPAPF